MAGGAQAGPSFKPSPAAQAMTEEELKHDRRLAQMEKPRDVQGAAEPDRNRSKFSCWEELQKDCCQCELDNSDDQTIRDLTERKAQKKWNEKHLDFARWFAAVAWLNRFTFFVSFAFQVALSRDYLNNPQHVDSLDTTALLFEMFVQFANLTFFHAILNLAPIRLQRLLRKVGCSRWLCASCFDQEHRQAFFAMTLTYLCISLAEVAAVVWTGLSHPGDLTLEWISFGTTVASLLFDLTFVFNCFYADRFYECK